MGVRLKGKTNSVHHPGISNLQNSIRTGDMFISIGVCCTPHHETATRFLCRVLQTDTGIQTSAITMIVAEPWSKGVS